MQSVNVPGREISAWITGKAISVTARPRRRPRSRARNLLRPPSRSTLPDGGECVETLYLRFATTNAFVLIGRE